MDWSSIIERIREFIEIRNNTQQQFNDFWADNLPFTWRWWLKAAMLVLPWILWCILRKKESTGRLLLAGFFVAVVSVYLDEMGVNMGLWFYTVSLNPYIYGSTAYNVSMLPVVTMLFIQFFPKVKPVYKAIVFAALGAFVSEPILSAMGLYQNVKWEYWYSFPILFIQYWIAHRLTLLKSFRPVGED